MQKKPEAKNAVYYELFKLLDYLEAQRPGIRERVWDFLLKHQQFSNSGNIYPITLFYFGPKDKKELEGEYKGVFDWINTAELETLRDDYHLIWSEFAEDYEDIETFYVRVTW